jgi:hypothetical protein
MERQPNLLFERPRRSWCGRLGRVGGTVFLLTAGTACDPTFRLNGTVKSPAGASVSGAKVRFSCNGVAQGKELETQSDGSFGEVRIGWYEDDCVVRVDARGYEPKELAIGPYCRERSSYRRGACIRVEVDTTVEPDNRGGFIE